MHKNKFLSLLLVFSLVICGTMGTGKGAKARVFDTLFAP